MVGRIGRTIFIMFFCIMVSGATACQAEERTSFEDGLIAFEAGEYTLAVERWTALANGGDEKSLHALGRMYSTGIGVPEDPVKAAEFYQAAASKGYWPACFYLAGALIHGSGVEKDVDEGLRWLRTAAEASYAEAQFELGLIYLDGSVTPQDCGKAVSWIRRAAEQDFTRAQYVFGRMLYRGECVDQNEREAAKLVLRAADKGNKSAQTLLSEMYLAGRGIPQDRTTGYMWLRIAYPGAKIGDLELPGISLEERERAEAMAREWLLDHPLTDDDESLPGLN